tara:strand:+ start:910 stop:1176 length:267 start_codon:yes stop_codon:yes gene_type:complete
LNYFRFHTLETRTNRPCKYSDLFLGGNDMVKCCVNGCTNKADIIHNNRYFCATHYMEFFMQHAYKNFRLKNKIAGQLRRNKKQPKKAI